MNKYTSLIKVSSIYTATRAPETSREPPSSLGIVRGGRSVHGYPTRERERQFPAGFQYLTILSPPKWQGHESTYQFPTSCFGMLWNALDRKEIKHMEYILSSNWENIGQTQGPSVNSQSLPQKQEVVDLFVQTGEGIKVLRLG